MKVLIVDDNATNLLMFKTLVSRFEDCEPITFGTPAEALGWSERNQPDLVLLDYMMPEMDGIAFLRKFRGMRDMRDVPVVMVTADHESEVRHRALESGANDFLTKPIDKTEFMARIRNTLALRRSERALADRAAWLDQEVRKALARVEAREREAIFLLAKATEYRDPETGSHILRMANYTRLIGEKLGLPADQNDLLYTAAPMHDIGKVGIPDAILLKPARLNPAEFEMMKQHAVIGWRILEGHSADNRILQVAAEIALSHHERYDGSGYPNGLAGDAIPLSGRIVAVADVFDALTSSRPYKEPWSIDDAANYLRRNAGMHFDARCTDAFFSAWPEVMRVRAEHPDPPPTPRED